MPAAVVESSEVSLRRSVSELIPGFVPPADGRVRGVVIVGLDDPGLVNQVLATFPPTADGYETPIFVIEPRSEVVTPAIEQGAFTPSPRVRVFTDERCIEDFLNHCRSRIALSLPKHLVSGAATSSRWGGAIAEGLRELARTQQHEDQRARARLNALWATRGIDHWKRRYEDILAGREPARILMLTSRYSTFVQHAAKDLAEAFSEMECEARVLMEPDEHATLTTLYYLGEVEQFDPDLIVSINFPRAALGNVLPDGWPFVCWVQDAMPHLFSGAYAPKTPLDFMAGHIYADAAARARYTSESLLQHPVCVSTKKFHPGALNKQHADQFQCDIAYVSHRAQTPDIFHERFVAGAGIPPSLLPAVQRCRTSVREAVSAWPTESRTSAFNAAAAELAKDLGRPGDARMADLFLYQYVLPLGELLLRHETLEWAAQIAQTARLSFNIYGRGWEEHPTLSLFAAGPVGHGDELRACYQSAAVHLHASVLGCGHQRVWECALSGGLPLCRRSWDELYWHDWMESRAFVTSGIPNDVSFYKPRWPAYIIADHPKLMHMVRRRQLTPPPPGGWDHDYMHGLYAQIEYDETNRPLDAPVPPEHARPIRLLGDPQNLMFSTIDELQEKILCGVERSTWRTSLSRGVAHRVRATVSTACFAQRLLDLVASGINSADTKERIA